MLLGHTNHACIGTHLDPLLVNKSISIHPPMFDLPSTWQIQEHYQSYQTPWSISKSQLSEYHCQCHSYLEILFMSCQIHKAQHFTGSLANLFPCQFTPWRRRMRDRLRLGIKAENFTTHTGCPSRFNFMLVPFFSNDESLLCIHPFSFITYLNKLTRALPLPSSRMPFVNTPNKVDLPASYHTNDQSSLLSCIIIITYHIAYDSYSYLE